MKGLSGKSVINLDFKFIRYAWLTKASQPKMKTVKTKLSGTGTHY